MPLFRKKPVEIEARQVVDDVAAQLQLMAWAQENGGDVTLPAFGSHLIVSTLEGDMKASLGDWIIRGVQGEFYPCKPDIFEATYESVEERRAASAEGE